MNARFWTYWKGSWVKLTLRPGESVAMSHHSRHEEGWSSTSEEYEHCGDHVRLTIENDGTDCDGRMSSEHVLVCPIDNLRARVGHDGTLIPEWERESSRQRDYSAEAMGY